MDKDKYLLIFLQGLFGERLLKIKLLYYLGIGYIQENIAKI
jgi:hypothetical protein